VWAYVRGVARESIQKGVLFQAEEGFRLEDKAGSGPQTTEEKDVGVRVEDEWSGA